MARVEPLTEDGQRKARLTVYLLGATSAAPTVMGLVAWRALGTRGVWPNFASAAILLGLLVYVLRGGSHRVAAHLMLWVTWLALVLLAASAPQSSTALLVWLLTLPVSAALTMGAHQAAAWTLLAASGVAVSRALTGWIPHFAALDIANGISIEHCLMGVYLLVGTATALGERMRVTTLDKLIKAQTAVEAARDQAEEASRHKSRFVANMSHEIRTPMNGVIGMLEVFDDSELTEVSREQLRTIRQSAHALLEIINEVLDFSRIEAGHVQALAKEPVELRGLLSDLAALLRPTCAAREVALEVVVDDAVPRVVESDHGKLRQVLMNLAGNATKFTERGEIALRVRRSGADRYLFEVCDTGPGISLAAQGRIFDAFAQEDGSSTRRHGGTGLGLAIARALVGVLGGELQLESDPGVGSRFFFELALEAGKAPVQRREPTAVGAASLPRARVLVAEDDRVNRMVIGAMLGKLGLEFGCVSDGEAALEALCGPEPWDVVLMDVQMPKLDGHEVTRRVRTLDAPRGRVPIVALTANALERDRVAAHDAGMDDFVGKPIRMAELRAALSRVLPAQDDDMAPRAETMAAPGSSARARASA